MRVEQRTFNLETFVPPTDRIGDLGDGFYQEQVQIDGGRMDGWMDKFVAVGGVGALPVGSYDATPLSLGQLAKQYTLDDHFFHAAFGTSMLIRWSPAMPPPPTLQNSFTFTH